MPPYKAKAADKIENFEADGDGTLTSPRVPHRRNPDVVQQLQSVEARISNIEGAAVNIQQRVSNIEGDIDAVRIGQDTTNILLGQILAALTDVPVPPSVVLGAPTIPQLVQGGSVTFTQPITRMNFSGQVQVSIPSNSLPSGVTASSIPPATGNGVQITLNAASNAAVGTTNIQIAATASGITINPTTASLPVVAAAPSAPTVTLGVPTIPTLNAGQSVTFNVPINRTNTTEAVQLVVSQPSLPPGVTSSPIAPTTANQQAVTLTADNTVTTGTTSVRIGGTTPSNITVAQVQADLPVVAAAPPATYAFFIAIAPGQSNAQGNGISIFTDPASPKCLGLGYNNPTGTGTDGNTMFVTRGGSFLCSIPYDSGYEGNQVELVMENVQNNGQSNVKYPFNLVNESTFSIP